MCVLSKVTNIGYAYIHMPISNLLVQEQYFWLRALPVGCESQAGFVKRWHRSY